jgi:hypothetical protein
MTAQPHTVLVINSRTEPEKRARETAARQK